MITLLPLGKVDDRLLVNLQSRLVRALGFEIPIKDAHLDFELTMDEKRNQYDSTRLLLQLRTLYRANSGFPHKFLSVFPNDLFIPVLTFVFGEAELSGDVAIVSYYRLQNERYGLEPDSTLLLQRLLTESLHEIGHLYGLTHCHEPVCVMRS